MSSTNVFPVIHIHSADLAYEETRIAMDAGANGVFLIDHDGQDDELVRILSDLRDRVDVPKEFQIGVNFLSYGCTTAYDKASYAGADMVWLDNPGIRHGEMLPSGHRLRDHIKNAGGDGPEVLASVAFKYQPEDEDAVASVNVALGAEWTPVTSGAGTGKAPSVSKIKELSSNGRKGLGVASGMTLDNVSWFAPYASHILVATGIAKNSHQMDYEKLVAFIGKVRAA